MKTRKTEKTSKKYFDSSYLILAIISLLALTATFLISNSDFRFETKTAVFLTIVFAYLLIYLLFYLRQRHQISISSFENESSESVFNAEIEDKLLALEEANEFFGASLKPADMFRLVASRINDMIPFASSALFWVDKENSNFKIIGAIGKNAREFLNLKPDLSKGIAGTVFQSGKIECDEELVLEEEAISAEALNQLESAIAVPLKQNGNEIFGVVVLYGDDENKFDLNSQKLLEAVGERIASLFLSSMAFERSVYNALTDSLTNLPNERAFYLILENQIAESQRRPDERPLTILTIDIKNFAEINDRFGHVTGDKILAYATSTIKEQLRKMDFLARSVSDEFLAVLPTSSETTTREIIERIETAFSLTPFKTEEEKIYIKLNFGAATFWRDGETAQQLLQSARLEKKHSKNGFDKNVIRFPKEFVN